MPTKPSLLLRLRALRARLRFLFARAAEMALAGASAIEPRLFAVSPSRGPSLVQESGQVEH